jgi:hypothetical protein
MSGPKDSSDFIPLQTAELIELLCGDPTLPECDREPVRQLGELVQGLHHLRFHRKQVELKNAYEPFDPDTDDTVLVRLSASQKQQRLNGLFSDVAWLLDRAHYRHLCREDIDPFLRSASEWGIQMDVDFSAFDHIAIFARGEDYETRTLRNWRTLWRSKEIDVPIFRRLVLIMKLRQHPRLGPGVNTEHVYMKIFKDIPRADVDMLLPGARVTLKFLDHGRIGVGLFSGIMTMCYRMSTDLLHLVRDAVVKDSVLWGLAGGCIGYAYKSYYDYQQTRQAYHLTLTQSLYFQNLDSNAGVLARLFDEAEEQETRTTLLAYYCLWRYAGPAGMTAEELDVSMELYLDRYAEVPLMCETGEALSVLARLGLVKVAEGRYLAVGLPEALETLRAGWTALVPAAPVVLTGARSNSRVERTTS